MAALGARRKQDHRTSFHREYVISLKSNMKHMLTSNQVQGPKRLHQYFSKSLMNKACV